MAQSSVFISRLSPSLLRLKSAYDAELVEYIRARCYGRKWNPEQKAWDISINTTNLGALDQLQDVTYDDACLDLIESYRQWLCKAEQWDDQIQLPVDYSRVGSVTLRKFQVVGVQHLVNHKRVPFWDDMGLGKTLQAICALEYRQALPCVVICPSGLKTVWAEAWRSVNPDRKIQIVRNLKTKIADDAEVIILSYKMVASHGADILRLLPVALIIDESHEIKNFKLSRFKTIRRFSEHIPVRYLLTGTPMLNRPSELLAQLMILGILDDFGGFIPFIERYCAAKKTLFGWNYKGSSNLSELNSILMEKYALRRTKAQVASELPSKTVFERPVEISNYDEYLLEFYNMRQFSTGVDVTRGVPWMDRLRLLSAKGKLQAFESFARGILGTGNKLVVFAYHREIIDSVAKMFDCGVIDGQASDRQKAKAVSNFQTDPEQRIIAVNMRSGGVGWTLTAASVAVFLEEDWSPKIMEQCEDRVHRIGQSRPVSIYKFVGLNTIDEFMLQLGRDKSEGLYGVTDSHLSIEVELFNLLQNNLKAA